MTIIRTAILVTALSAGLCQVSSAQPASLQQEVCAAIEAYEKDSGATVGVSAVDLVTGRNLIARRDGQLFIPASNQKLLTTAFALVKLGAEFEFTTSVYRLGNDIIITGDGDPTLGDPVIASLAGKSIYAEPDRWATAVKQHFGQKLTGDIIVCTPTGQAGARHADWPKSQYQHWYAAAVANLNFHNNCLDVTFTLDAGAVAPHVTPVSRFIDITSRVKPSKRHRWALGTNDEETLVKLTGTISQSTKDPISVAIDKPALLLGRVLAERIISAGVAFDGKVRVVAPGDVKLDAAVELCSTKTPLSVALKRANKHSLNLAAECILIRAADGLWCQSWLSSGQVMAETMEKGFNLDAKDLVVRDGSGLSRKNRITPAAMAKLLARLAERKDAAVLLESLAISGQDGTLRRRFTEPAYRGQILAKTGSLAGVSCLSGYVKGNSDRPAMAFAILINDIPGGKTYRARHLQDSICRLLADAANRPIE